MKTSEAPTAAEVEASSAEEVPDGNARSLLNLEYRQTVRDIAPPPKEANSGSPQALEFTKW